MPRHISSATIVGIPFDAASSFRRGAAEAPKRIREALASDAGNRYSESLVDLSAPEVLGDDGDVDCAGDARGVRDAIESRIAVVVAGGSRPIALGGDHSVTYPVLRAVRPHAPRVTIVHIDAHCDIYDAYQGNRRSHASPFARIMEERLTDRLIQVCIRTNNDEHQPSSSSSGSATVCSPIVGRSSWRIKVRPSASSVSSVARRRSIAPIRPISSAEGCNS